MDLKQLGENLGLEEDEFIEIVELFAETAKEDIEKIEAAIKDKNTEHAADAAHSLKGASGNLGFTEISELSATLEKNARNNNLDNAEEMLATINANLLKITEQL